MIECSSHYFQIYFDVFLENGVVVQALSNFSSILFDMSLSKGYHRISSGFRYSVAFSSLPQIMASISLKASHTASASMQSPHKNPLAP